jgi:hypothetical protein
MTLNIFIYDKMTNDMIVKNILYDKIISNLMLKIFIYDKITFYFIIHFFSDDKIIHDLKLKIFLYSKMNDHLRAKKYPQVKFMDIFRRYESVFYGSMNQAGGAHVFFLHWE